MAGIINRACGRSHGVRAESRREGAPHPGRSAGVMLAVAALVCALSLYIVWYGDAPKYRFSFATGEPIGSLSDIGPVSVD